MPSSHSRRRWWRPVAIVGAPVAAALAMAAVYGVPDMADPAALTVEAEQALAHGQFATARRLARSAVAADTASPRAHLALARAAIGEGDGVTGEAEVARAIALGSTSDPALLAEARLEQGDTARALTLSGGRSALALRVRGRALAAAGRDAEAQAAFDRATTTFPRDAATWIDAARHARAIDDMGGAADAARRALALDPANAAALALAALTVRDRIGSVAALPWFERALALDPSSYVILIDYAATLGEVGRGREMLATLRRALAVRPGDPVAFYQLAVLAARGGRIDLARSLLDRAGSGIAGRPAVLLFGASLDLRAGDPEQAVASLRNLLGIQPMNVRARQLLAMALLARGAAREALDVLRPIALRTDADSYTLILAARGFDRVGDGAGAAALRERAARTGATAPGAFDADDGPAATARAAARAPEDPAAVVPLVRALIVGGDLSGAVRRAHMLAVARPGVPAAWLALGDARMLAGRAHDAAIAYGKAAALRFDEPTMLRHVAALEAAGDRGAAAATLLRFLAQNPQNVAALRLAARGATDPATAVMMLERLRARLGDRDAALLADLATARRAVGEGARIASEIRPTHTSRRAPAQAGAQSH